MGVFRGVTLTPVSSTEQALALSRQGRGDKSRADLFDESLAQDTSSLGLNGVFDCFPTFQSSLVDGGVA